MRGLLGRVGRSGARSGVTILHLRYHRCDSVLAMGTARAEARRDAARQRIVEAVFRLVVRGGVGEASLRKVAEESGINIGSVRHYFGSHEALLVAAAEEVGARMERRLLAAAALPSGATAVQRRDRLEAVVRALLPQGLDERQELVVLVEFIVAARLRPEFRAVADRMGADMRRVLTQALEAAGVSDSRLEAERLAVVLEGITFEAVYPHGSAGAPDLVAVLRHHIGSLIP